MAEPMNSWGHHNLKTAADVRRMLQGLLPLTEQEGEALPPTQGVPAALPAGAVSATVEIVDAQPLKTTETVQVIAPAVPKRRR